MMIRFGLSMTIAGGLCAVAGCGGAPLPIHAQTDAVAAVRSADELGSTETPLAAYQLELARGEVRDAETLIRQGHMEQARDSYELAKINAELAMSLRREDQARTTSDAARSHIQELRQGEAVTSGGAAPVPASTTTTITTTQAQ
jgi:hypothetical protein